VDLDKATERRGLPEVIVWVDDDLYGGNSNHGIDG